MTEQQCVETIWGRHGGGEELIKGVGLEPLIASDQDRLWVGVDSDRRGGHPTKISQVSPDSTANLENPPGAQTLQVPPIGTLHIEYLFPARLL